MATVRRFLTADVFTERALAGNQLAVILDAEGLSGDQMQSIAVEFNYSETVFKLPPQKPHHAARLRIFTPQMEVPFAGHPNVGAAFLLARNDPSLRAATFSFEQAAGAVAVEILRREDVVVGAIVAAPEPLRLGSEFGAESVGGSLSLDAAQIRTDRHRPVVASVGLPAVLAEVVDRRALRQCAPSRQQFNRLLEGEECDAIFAYCRTEDGTLFGRIDARMFFQGVFEDPATGSACGALASLLAQLDPVPSFSVPLIIQQGEDMGRLSIIETRIRKHAGRLSRVRVGGRCVQVMAGKLVI